MGFLFHKSKPKDHTDDILGIKQAIQLLTHEIELLKAKLRVPAIKKKAIEREEEEPKEEEPAKDGLDEIRALRKSL